jgi:DUF4097 and DUF4098 domain-containing protein YvlB
MPTFDTPEPISVTLELGVGDIRIVASDRTDTVVDVRPSDPTKKSDVSAAEQTRVEYENGRLLIKAPRSWRQFTPRGGAESVAVRIDLPSGSHVAGEAGVAALHGTGRLGELHYKAGIGDVHVDEAGPIDIKSGVGDVGVARAVGRTDVRTGSGAVRIATIEGPATIKNSNGETWIGEATGDLRVNGANGRIVVELARAAVAAKTANGDVRLDEVARGSIVAHTALGKVEVGVRDGVTAWLDLDTRFGNVHSDLAAAQQPDRVDEAVEVHARSSFGDITIRRVPAPSPAP